VHDPSFRAERVCPVVPFQVHMHRTRHLPVTVRDRGLASCVEIVATRIPGPRFCEEPAMLFSMLALDGNTNFDVTDMYSCNGPPCSSWTFPTETYLPASTFLHAHDPPQEVSWQPVDWRTVKESCSAYGQMMGTCTPEPYPTTWIA
jgi:hypothetical protein